METSAGTARATLTAPPRPCAVVALGHGAGGGVSAPDLLAVAGELVAGGCAVALVEQPYRVAGRRAPAPARSLDAAWVEVMAVLRAQLPGLPLVCGGRSSGSRVALRTAGEVGATGVVALAFPLRPPGRAGVDRSAELLAAPVPVLVVQGSRDPFGSAADVKAVLPRRTAVTVVDVAGADHSFRARKADGRSSAECVAQAAGAVGAWLLELLGQASTET